MFRRIAFAAAISAPAALWGSCVDDGASLSIECQVVPTVEENSCLYDPEAEACVLQGALNLRYAEGYSLHLVVSNGLFSRESMIPVMTEPNNIDVVDAEIAIENVGGELIDFGGLPNPFSVPTSGRVPVQGRGIASVSLPRDYVQLMRDQNFDVQEGTIVLRVQLLGKTDGLVDVESRKWTWPVNVLNVEGCRATEDDMAVVCNLGQDGDIFPFCS